MTKVGMGILIAIFGALLWLISTFLDPYYRCSTYTVGNMPSYCLDK